MGAISASAQTARRGGRHWYVQKFLAREPGDPTSNNGQVADLVRIGKAQIKPKADDARAWGVIPRHSSCEADEQGGAIRGGAGGAKDGDRGECEPAKHGPDSEPGNRVTGVGTHTAHRENTAKSRHTPEVGAVCPNWARTNLCGGARSNARSYRNQRATQEFNG